jgi:oligosaccharide amylase
MTVRGNEREKVVSDIDAYNERLGVRLHILDIVHNEKNVFLRRVCITNERNDEREIRVFFDQEFRISESRRGDTAFYDPRVNAIIHYKGHSAFLINAVCAGKQFNDYTVGLFGIEDKTGSFIDAEDGVLSRNPIEHGSVDSVVGLTLTLAGQESELVDYWIAAGHSVGEVHALNAYVLEEGPERLIASTQNYWKAWLEKESRNLSVFDADLRNLYKQSLAIIRVHADNHGGIIASSDADMLNQGRDTYSYVWPRDSAISVNALDRAGYIDAAQRYFSFIAKLIEPDGYLMHKYRVDGVLGSSWHPWVRDGVTELPIQEDETALVIYMLSQHYEYAKDIEFIESLYNPFIEPASQFLCRYTDEETGLPSNSYDLWEQKYGISTYTASAVYGALLGAAHLASLLGKRDPAENYRRAAERVKKGILGYLYDTDMGMFVKLLRHKDGRIEYDKTVDMSSFFGPVYFGVLAPDDKRALSSAKVVKERLLVPTQFGGYMRYEGDDYYRTAHDAPPNAWCVTTLWMAQYIIKVAKTKKELREAYDLLRWTFDRARKSGVLPEQIHPYTGQHLSAAPLIWSQAEFVTTVEEYMKKYNSLG